ncbi:MAG: SRPBCC family protein [Crocinitomicaceae bacterium]|nr:SRPBCC family protein [Crocinitomicaceae bacterium]
MKRKVQVNVKCDKQAAFDLISGSDKLADWLKKSGPIPGVKDVDILEGPYDHVGARRKTNFIGGDSVIEKLVEYNPPGNYTYEVTEFTNFFGKLTNKAYGQFWFDEEGEDVRVTWEYSFTSKNFFARILMSVVLSMGYRKFMLKGLMNAKGLLESKK